MPRMSNVHGMMSLELADIIIEETKGAFNPDDEHGRTADKRFKRLPDALPVYRRMLLYWEQLRCKMDWMQGYKDGEYRVDDVPELEVPCELRGIPGQDNPCSEEERPVGT